MAGNRLSDKTEPLKIILSFVSPVFLAIIIYIIIPLKTDMAAMRTEFNDKFDKMESAQKEQTDRFYEYYENCKNEINLIRKETSEKIFVIQEKLLAMFKAERK
jgi:hypothetical protein